MTDRNNSLEEARETRWAPKSEPKQIMDGVLVDDDDDDDDVKRASAVALAVVAAQTPDDVRRGLACSDSLQAKIVDKWKREHQWEQQQQQATSTPTASASATSGASLWSSVVRVRVDDYASASCSLPASPPRNQGDGTLANERLVTPSASPSPMLEAQMATTSLPPQQLLAEQEDEDNKDVKRAIRMALAVASNPNLDPQEIRRVANETVPIHGTTTGESSSHSNHNLNMILPPRKRMAPTIDMDNDDDDSSATSTTASFMIHNQHLGGESWWWTFLNKSKNNTRATSVVGSGVVVINMAFLLDSYMTPSFWRTWAIVNVTFFFSCLILGRTMMTTKEKNETTTKRAAQVQRDHRVTITPTPTPALGDDRFQEKQPKDASIVTTATATATTSSDDSDSKYDRDDDDDDVVLKTLGAWQPDATEQECRRFLKAREGDLDGASTQLASYLSWKASLSGIDDRSITHDNNDDDDDSWQRACYSAIKTTDPTSTATISSIPKLPCLVHFYKSSTKDDNHNTGGDQNKEQGFHNDVMISSNGTRIIHVLPAQMDAQLATPATYALAVAIYLDLTLDPSSMEKITVVLDVRAGAGWANPTPMSLVPFIKIVASLLNDHFPERLSRLVLFPLPFAATFIFNMVKQFLDQDTASKIEVCPGPGNHNSPVPDQVGLFFNDYVMQTMEDRRLSLFIPSKS